MRRLIIAAVAALLLSACSEPLLVPEAGPNAPGFSMKPPPPPPPSPPRVELMVQPVGKSFSTAGAIDAVVRHKGSFEISGWAMLDDKSPRGVLRLVLPRTVDATVDTVVNVERPDVVEATSSEANRWAGFTVSLQGSLPEGAGVCVLSRSPTGNFKLAGSSDKLCPS